MDTSHCPYGFILLLLVFHSSMFSFASKIDGDQKRFLSNSNHRTELGRSHQQDKEHLACTNHNSTSGPITRIYCRDGYVITKINFADYGNPTGTCDHFRHGNCGAPATLRLVKKNCLGNTKCILFVTDEMFGPSHCKGAPTLAVQAICTKT